MAVSNKQLFVWSNGRKIVDSNVQEIIFKAIAVSADGNSNGLNISESSGKFDFNGKVLGNIGAGTAAGQALSYSQLGAANGVASLDSASKIPAAQLPNSVMEYKGTFNPSTHVPNLQNTGAAIKSSVIIQGLTYTADVAGGAGNLISITYVDPAAPSQALSVGVVGNAITVNLATDSGSNIISTADDVKTAVEASTPAAALVDLTGSGSSPLTAQSQTYLVGGADAASAGDVYKATAGGSHNFGAGAITFVTGDYAIYNSSGVWELSHSGADAVISVNGKSGAVSLNTDDIGEGTTNLYFSGKTTDNLTEGTVNKYYSSTLFNSDFSSKTTDDLTEGTVNLYWTTGKADTWLGTKTTDALTEGTVNLYFNGKTTDNLTEGTVNKYYSSTLFNSDFGSKTTDDLTEGTLNLYYDATTARGDLIASTITDGDTTHAPDGNSVFDALALKKDIADGYASYTNKEGGEITIRQFVFMSAAGEVQLLQSTDAVGEDTIFGCVKAATIANDAAGQIWLPEMGTRITGFSSLTIGSTLWAHASVAGSYVTTRPTSGKSILLGRVVSTTDIIFIGRFEHEFA